MVDLNAVQRKVYCMRCILPLLVVLASCATSSPSPSEYQQGAYVPVRPAPAPTRPGVGLPPVGQPGQSPTVYPRSPHKRVLPPQKGPGIWAGDEPSASNDPKARPSKLYPPNYEFEDIEAGNKCGRAYGKATNRINREKDNAIAQLEKTLTADQFECFFVRLYARCVNQLYTEREAERERILSAENSSGIAPMSLQRLRDHVDGLKQKVCKGNLPWGAEQLLNLTRKYMTDVRQNPDNWKDY